MTLKQQSHKSFLSPAEDKSS